MGWLSVAPMPGVHTPRSPFHGAPGLVSAANRMQKWRRGMSLPTQGHESLASDTGLPPLPSWPLSLSPSLSLPWTGQPYGEVRVAKNWTTCCQPCEWAGAWFFSPSRRLQPWQQLDPWKALKWNDSDKLLLGFLLLEIVWDYKYLF